MCIEIKIMGKRSWYRQRMETELNNLKSQLQEMRAAKEQLMQQHDEMRADMDKKLNQVEMEAAAHVQYIQRNSMQVQNELKEKQQELEELGQTCASLGSVPTTMHHRALAFRLSPYLGQHCQEQKFT
jgi:predicted RNase H-like nuclease (RuvC/YqgF family)